MTKRYINVAYKDRDMAKSLGARWDASVRRWYCPPGSALAKVYSWRQASTRPINPSSTVGVNRHSGSSDLFGFQASPSKPTEQLSLLG